MAVPAGATADGLEIQMGVNHVGNWRLAQRLLPRLLVATEPRVVVVTSEAHRLVWTAPGRCAFEAAELRRRGPWRAYALSKLANLLFAREMARRYPQIAPVAVHPGVVGTDLFNASRESSVLMRTGLRLFGRLWSSVDNGAKNQTWAATCARAELQNGGYYTPVGKLNPGSALSRDKRLAKRLWDWTENELWMRSRNHPSLHF